MEINRVSITPKAALIVDKIREQHGELIFHQSGGCCDGSSPMCLQKKEFLIGSRDILLGIIHDCAFYIASDQFSYFKNTHIKVDVAKGIGSSFSLEIPLGLRFKTVSRLFTEDELSNLEEIKT